MKRSLRLLILGPVTAVVALAGLLVAPAEAAKRPFCNQPWGSRAKQLGAFDPSQAQLRDVRSAPGPCYDRLVFELDGPVTSYVVQYVGQVTADGSGAPVPLRGGAFLSVSFGGRTYNDSGRSVYAPRSPSEVVDVRGYQSFRQVALAGSFESLTSFGVGVRATLPFRVLVLPGPGTHNRIVLDVSHRWI